MIKSYLVTWNAVKNNLDGITSQINNYSIINSDAPEQDGWNNLGMVWYYKQFHFAITDFIENSSEDIMCFHATDATSTNLLDIHSRAKEILSHKDNWVYAPHFTHEAWGEGATKLRDLGNGFNNATQTDGILFFISRDLAVLMKQYMDYLDSTEDLKSMRSGWGLDYVWCTITLYHQKYIIRDRKFIVTHPEGSSYQHDKAAEEMGSVFKRFDEFSKIMGWDVDEVIGIRSKISHKMSNHDGVGMKDFYNYPNLNTLFHIVSVDDSRIQNKDQIVSVIGKDNLMEIKSLDARIPENLINFLIDNPEFKLTYRGFKLGEIGCFASHYLAWKGLLESDANTLAVFEDDAWIDEEFSIDLKLRLEALPADYDVFSVYADVNQRERFTDKHVVSDLISKSYQDWSTLGYVVSRSGAKKLVDHVHSVGMNEPVDWFIFRNAERGFFNVYTTPPKNPMSIRINDVTGSQVQQTKMYSEFDIDRAVGFIDFVRKNGDSKYSQINQDLFARFICGDEPGFFVEFGACDGVYLSNTLMLEKQYGWTGILAEPLPSYYKELIKNRSCSLSSECVSDKTGDEVKFVEVDIQSDKGLSGMSDYVFQDHHSETRKNNSTEIVVSTISLDDLLDKFDAPKVVDYLSVDTEGSEFMILDSYSFSRDFKCITVEHNGTSNGDKIHSLLTSKGYVRILKEFSKWDDWYIKKDLV